LTPTLTIEDWVMGLLYRLVLALPQRPITARAHHTGGGGEPFKSRRKEEKTAGHPEFPPAKLKTSTYTTWDMVLCPRYE